MFPLLPIIATAPTSHNQDALRIGEIVKVIRLHFSFQTDCIQVHLTDVAKIRLQACLVATQEHIRRPASATDEDFLSVHIKLARAGGIEVGSNLANAKPD